jgi:ribonuclease P/MRP protein subunit POP1
MVTRGVPQTCARIYRLPSNDAELRKKWINQIPTPASKKAHAGKAPFPQRPSQDAPAALQRSYLAATIFAAPPARQEFPCVPDEEDLIGFITTGNFNLGEGKGIGIGSLLLTKVKPVSDASITISHSSQVAKAGLCAKEERFCIIRDAGQALGRLARWELA